MSCTLPRISLGMPPNRAEKSIILFHKEKKGEEISDIRLGRERMNNLIRGVRSVWRGIVAWASFSSMYHLEIIAR